MTAEEYVVIKLREAEDTIDQLHTAIDVQRDIKRDVECDLMTILGLIKNYAISDSEYGIYDMNVSEKYEPEKYECVKAILEKYEEF